MDYKLYIREDNTGKPIAGARVDFLDYGGRTDQVVSSFTTGPDGVVTLQTGVNDFEIANGGGISITADGYGAAAVFAGPLDYQTIIFLTKQGGVSWWWVAAAAAGGWFLFKKKRK